MKSVFVRKFIPSVSHHGKYYEIVSHSYHMFAISLDADRDSTGNWSYKGELLIMKNGTWDRVITNQDICLSGCGVQIENEFKDMRNEFCEYISKVYTEEVTLMFNKTLHE